MGTYRRGHLETGRRGKDEGQMAPHPQVAVENQDTISAVEIIPEEQGVPAHTTAS